MSFFSKGKPALGWVMGLALMYWAQGGDAAQLAAFETPPFNPGERLVLDAQELKWIKDNSPRHRGHDAVSVVPVQG